MSVSPEVRAAICAPAPLWPQHNPGRAGVRKGDGGAAVGGAPTDAAAGPLF
jgi:hypothetical protein